MLHGARAAGNGVDGPPEGRQQPPAARVGILAHAEHRDHHVLARQLDEHVVLLSHEPGQLEAAGLRAAHVDGEAQRVVAEHSGGAGQALVEHVEPGDLADGRPRAPQG